MVGQEWTVDLAVSDVDMLSSILIRDRLGISDDVRWVSTLSASIGQRHLPMNRWQSTMVEEYG